MKTSQIKQKNKAIRVISIRRYLKLSRDKFAKAFGIPKGTLQHWENPDDKSGLSEKGAIRLQQALLAYGIHSSVTWFMDGLGNAPDLPKSLAVSERELKKPEYKSKEQNYIREELDLFHRHYKEAVSLFVDNEKMLPIYGKGDVVAGIKLFNDHIQEVIGKICIVMTIEDKLLLRLVNSSNIPLHYKLTCINAHEDQIITQLKFAAPVVFLRKTVE